jgi:hypothetical protein
MTGLLYANNPSIGVWPLFGVRLGAAQGLDSLNRV